MLNLISRFACIWRSEVSDFFNSEAPMQSEQDRQLKREALVYQDRKDGSDGNFRQRVLSKHWELWKPLSGNISESPWVSYIHQYPWMPMLIEVEDVASAASACDVQLKSFQVSRPSTPKAPSEEVRMCKLRPRDGWLLSLFSKNLKAVRELWSCFSQKRFGRKQMMPLWDLWDVWSAGISVVKTIVCYVTATLSDVAYGRASHLGSRIEKMQWNEV